MEERLKIKGMIAKLSLEDSLNREQQDRVPISPEEDYVLKEIQRIHQIPTRAKTWRWLLGNYAKIEWAERLVAASRVKEQADATLTSLIKEL